MELKDMRFFNNEDIETQVEEKIVETPGFRLPRKIRAANINDVIIYLATEMKTEKGYGLVEIERYKNQIPKDHFLDLEKKMGDMHDND